MRNEIARVLLERADAIVSDSVAIFPYSGPQPRETDYCERLGRKLLELMGASLEGRLAAESENLADLQRRVAALYAGR